jgi:hypothetical protein
MTHFISQSAPNIRKKLKRLKYGPQISQAEILNVAFKVYNYHEGHGNYREGQIRRGAIRPNSRCWPKPFDNSPPTSSQLTRPGKIPNTSLPMFALWP